VETRPVGTITLDGDGRVRTADGAATALLGPDLPGADLHDRLHGSAHRRGDCPFHAVLGGGRAHRGTDAVTGRTCNVEPLVVDGRVEGAVVLVGGPAPADDPAARDRFLAELDRVLQPLDDAEEVMTAAARLLGEHLAVDRCAYAEAEADEDHFTMTGSYATGLPPLTGRFAMSQFGDETLRQMRAGEPYVVADAFSDPRVRPDQRGIYEQTGFSGVICLPLHKGGRFVAAMAVHQRTPRLWTAADVDLVTAVVARCWESVQRVHAVAAVREGEERYRLIVERAADAIFLADADLRYIDVNAAACALLGYSREELLARTVVDLVRPEDAERLADLVVRLRAGDAPTEVWDLVRADGATVPVELSLRAGARGQLQAIGRDITARRRAEVERERLLAREREANERLRRLQTTTAALSRATTPGAVLDVAAAHAEGLGGVAVVVPRGARLDAVVVRGPDARPDAEALARAARDGVPVWAGVPHAVPLLVEGRAVAVLGLWPERPLDEEDRAALLSAVEQCALAYDRARLTEAEREVAEVLQRSLLPAALPDVARLAAASRYTPAAAHTRAGGDWYEMLPVGDTRVALVAGDVVGHGPTAAAVMGQLRSALAAALLDGSGPAAALERLDAFAARVAGSTGSTCACLVLDWATGDLTWALAGHPPVLLLDEDGARLLDDPAALGAVLGVRPRRPYREVTRRLAPGSSLVLYTDGLVERRGEGLDDGMERLLAVAGALAGEGPGTAVAGLVDGLLTSAGPADDVALLVVRLVPEPLEVELPAVARSMARLRRVVEQWGTRAGLGEEALDDLHLVLGEAAANAAEHAYPDGSGDVRCSLVRERDGAVRFTVRDGGRWRPVPVDNGHRGHGLRVMQQLSEGFRVERGPEGTTVAGRLLPAAQVVPPPSRRPIAPGPDDSPVVVEERSDGAGRAVLALRGDLDLAGRDTVAAALARAGRGAVLDLTGLRYLSSAGVALLAGAPDVAVRVAAGSAPARVLALTGLAGALDVDVVAAG
jgi:PAS domain S-box-containing protein